MRLLSLTGRGFELGIESVLRAAGCCFLLTALPVYASELKTLPTPVFQDVEGLSVDTLDLHYYFSAWWPGSTPERALTPPNLELAVESLYISKRLALKADELFEADIDRDTRYAQDRLRRKKMDQWLAAEVAAKLTELDWDSLAKEEYLANPEKYEQPEQLRASHILVKTEDKRLLEAMLLVEEARLKYQEGEDFDVLARAYSESDSGLKGGDVGYFSKGKMVPAFEQAAFDLKNIGDVSDLVVTQFGVHLILLTEIIAPAKAPFETVKPFIIEDLNRRYAQSIRDELLDRERALMLEPENEYDRDLIEAIRENPSLLSR